MQGNDHESINGDTHMPDLVAELAERSRPLATEDRSRLVELRLETLHEPPLSEIEAAWDLDFVTAYERGEVETYSAEDVFAEAGSLSDLGVR